MAAASEALIEVGAVLAVRSMAQRVSGVDQFVSRLADMAIDVGAAQRPRQLPVGRRPGARLRRRRAMPAKVARYAAGQHRGAPGWSRRRRAR